MEKIMKTRVSQSQKNKLVIMNDNTDEIFPFI